MRKSLLWAALVLATAGCGSGDGQAAAPEVFGPAGYRGLTLGMSKEAALATGKLAAAPTSNLDGCADHPYAGGPAPDPARMAAEDAAEKKSRDLNRKADEAEKSPSTSAEDSAEKARLYADATAAIADVAEKREARDKAFTAEGGASFGKDGLRQLAAPPTAKTAEGIGMGSTIDEAKRAYEPRGLKLGPNGRYQFDLTDKPGWRFELTTTPDNKVAAISMISSADCA